jgi:hypothetical protein
MMAVLCLMLTFRLHLLKHQHQQLQLTARQQQQRRRVAVPLPPGFRYNKVVTIVAFDRFHYFRHVINQLLEAWGSEDYVVAIWIDGAPKKEASFSREGWEQIVAYSQQLQWLSRDASVGFRDVLVDVAPTNLGVWANKKRGVAGAMQLTDFAVVLEDDIVLSRDALRWFEWHVTSGLIFERPDIAIATCWSTSFPHSPGAVEAHDLLLARQLGLLDKYWVDAWAQPWGWALWRRTWDELGMNSSWNGQDFQLGQALKARGRFETMPLVARCNNIGSVGQNKKGELAGHVHQRAITSEQLPATDLDQCWYSELERANHTAPIDLEPLYKQLVPAGLRLDTKHLNSSLTDRFLATDAFMAAHPVSSNWLSTC